jgi:hypothetical protein
MKEKSGKVPGNIKNESKPSKYARNFLIVITILIIDKPLTVQGKILITTITSWVKIRKKIKNFVIPMEESFLYENH